MERQAGLGRSLREVIESLTPVEPEMAAQFDATELVHRLDELLVDVHELRDVVHHLTVVVGEDTAARADTKTSKQKKHKGKKHKGEKPKGEKKAKARHD
jgi:hypothetical protein